METGMNKALLAALTLLALPSGASAQTLRIYDIGGGIIESLKRSAFPLQDLDRLEGKGLIQSWKFPADGQPRTMRFEKSVPYRIPIRDPRVSTLAQTVRWTIQTGPSDDNGLPVTIGREEASGFVNSFRPTRDLRASTQSFTLTARPEGPVFQEYSDNGVRRSIVAVIAP